MYSTWEYLTIDICDTIGKADINLINEKLNELGSQGWRLVTAYTNELGKNGISVGGIGINSTADQNIFIFEREVLKETEEEIRQRKELEKKQEELLEKQKIEKMKETIKCFDDLMNDPKIKNEAELLRKMYGETAYKHYLEKKAKELGIN